MFFQLSFGLFLLWLPAAWAAASTYSQQICMTKFASTQPARVSTKTIAITIILPATQRSTSTPSITVTPAPNTFMQTVYQTSIVTVAGPQATDTFSTTSTLYTTTTSTLSSSYTLTITGDAVIISNTGATTTIPAPSGFTPLASSDPGAKKIRRKQIGKARRAAEAERGLLGRAVTSNPVGSQARYPSAVTCTVAVEIISTSTSIITAKTTATVRAPTPIITRTTTSILTTTSATDATHAATTLSFSTTSTISTSTVEISTATITTTPTQTVVEPGPTYYAQCGPDNIISSYNGIGVDRAGFASGYALASTNAYDCCVACAQTPDCAGTAFLPQYNECDIALDGGTCNGAVVYGHYFTGTGTFPGEQVSNGQCGQLQYALFQ